MLTTRFIAHAYNGENDLCEALRQAEIMPYLNSLLMANDIDAEKYQQTISKLSNKRLAILLTLTTRLSNLTMLNKVTFDEVFFRVKSKMPAPPHETVMKCKHGLRNRFMTESGTSFFQQKHARRNSTLFGGDGTIAPAFTTEDSEKPDYAIKWMSDSYTRYVTREAKYQCLLLRKHVSVIHYKNKEAVKMSWHQGVMLHTLTPEAIKAVPIIQRIRCFISLLTDLNIIHQSLCSHGDLYTANGLIDFENETFHLIDFCNTTRYDPRYFSMGDIQHLRKFMKLLFCDAQENPGQSLLHECMNHVMQRVNYKTDDHPPTSEQLLELCTAIVENAQMLDETILHALYEKTIDRTKLTLEDVIRGYRARL